MCYPSPPLVAWFIKVLVAKRTAKAANNIQCYSLAPTFPEYLVTC